MRNIRLTLEYDGTGYAGWQVQDNAPTIQGTVETALGRMLRHPVRVTASGRTDAGVHALAQAANFRTAARIPLRGFVHGLNSMLPADITVRAAAHMPADFDSRRSAKAKTYQYFLLLAATPSAFARRTSWHVPALREVAAMAAAARDLVGTHDFGAFRSAGCDAPHAVRALSEAAVERRGEYLELRLTGTAFLRHMVRIIAGTLVEVGLGKRPPSCIAELLVSGDRDQAGPTAPPQGLFLARVEYGIEPVEIYP